MMITLDKDGYPTDEFIDFIKHYDPYKMPILDFIDILCEGWYFGDWGYRLHRKYAGKRKFELHTGGWSGNETTIEAVLSNVYLTHFKMQYVRWEAGGHYYFEIPT